MQGESPAIIMKRLSHKTLYHRNLKVTKKKVIGAVFIYR